MVLYHRHPGMKRDRCSRERIIEAARDLFHLRGLQSTALDDILEASGVCRSNFYYHFRSKEDLGLEVLRRQADAFEAGYMRGLLENEALPARRRLELLYKDVASRHRADGYRRGCPFGNLAAELSGIHPEFRRRLSAFFARWEESVDRCLREGVARRVSSGPGHAADGHRADQSDRRGGAPDEGTPACRPHRGGCGDLAQVDGK